jgi:hypothetical protein
MADNAAQVAVSQHSTEAASKRVALDLDQAER